LLTFSFACLYRPPHTPMQFFTRDSRPQLLSRLLDESTAIVKKAGFETRESAGPWDAMVSEFISYSDRRSTPILVEASIKKNLRYRGEITRGVYDFFGAALKNAGFDTAIENRHSKNKGIFPWDDIETGVSKSFLRKNYDGLRRGNQVSACISPPLGIGSCQGCGACLTTSEKEKLTRRIKMTRKAKAAEMPQPVPLRFRLRGIIPRKWSICGNNFIFAAFTRLLLRKIPAWIPYFIRFEQGIDRVGAYGDFLGDFLVHSEAPLVEFERVFTSDACIDDDVTIIAIKPSKKPFSEDIACIASRFFLTETPDSITIGKQLDGFLNKYRLKHLKRWQGNRLRWEIQQGHAKKSGISSIEWEKETAILTVNLLHWPESHLIRQIAPKADIEIVIPPGEGVKKSIF